MKDSFSHGSKAGAVKFVSQDNPTRFWIVLQDRRFSVGEVIYSLELGWYRSATFLEERYGLPEINCFGIAASKEVVKAFPTNTHI